MGAKLCIQTLAMAVKARRPKPGLVHHSEQGMQYFSTRYCDAIEAIGAVASMSRRDNCYDNAIFESYWSTLKLDCLEGKDYRTRQEATPAIFAYLESFYNHSRRHSSLGYLSPAAFEMAKN